MATCVIRDLLEYIHKTETANLLSYEIFEDLTVNIRARNIFMFLPDIIVTARTQKLSMIVNLANMETNNNMRYIKRMHFKDGIVTNSFSYTRKDIKVLLDKMDK